LEYLIKLSVNSPWIWPLVWSSNPCSILNWRETKK
jgi:hypothetical protein